MIRVGITGGMGSGKSSVCRMFALLGVPVYDCDAEAKRLMENDAATVSAIKGAFGESTYRQGHLDRSTLAQRVFGDSAALARLNGIVHPAVARDFEQWTKRIDEEKVPYVLIESAILFESGLEKGLDAVVAVVSPMELRIARSMARDGSDRSMVRARIAAQMDDRERNMKADYIMVNDERHLLWIRALALDRKFKRIYANR